jgi:hypothetical protein
MILHDVDDIQYIAQFMIMHANFKVADQMITAPLTNCDGFSLMFTLIQYYRNVPSFYFNITYEGVQVYPGLYPSSTFSLMLSQSITADWNLTDI